MEQYWTKKKIEQLLKGDADRLESFLSQYEPVVFTWMYYQVGADANIAADLTGRTFVRALGRLREFEPRDMTMFQWLKDEAKTARDEGLLHWQLKPQRPWAWSQLPDGLLKSLSELRSEPLTEKVTANPFVQEIVQATLAELEQTDRELMMHRYSHLDMPTGIAAEMNLSVETVNDLLYKCRHSFRRLFFHLISSVNPGFSESNIGTGIEVMDSNLEKLLRATSMYQTPSETQEAAIRERYFEAAQQSAQQHRPAERKPTVIIAAAGVAVVAIIGAIVLFALLKRGGPSDAPSTETAAAGTRSQGDTPRPSAAKPAAGQAASQKDMDQEELKMIFQLGQAGNLEALLEILKSGQFTSQLAAAHFIGKLGTPSAIELLQQAESQWYPNGPKQNPFAEAIAEIAKRYPGQITISEQPAAPAAAPPSKAESKPTAVGGYVRDFMGKPIAGAKLELAVNPVFSSNLPKRAAQSVSDEQGQYAIKETVEGPFLLDCRYGAKEQRTRQAIWCSKDKVRTLDFGGKPALGGRIHINGRPLEGLKLTLCDSIEPEKSAFLGETTVDASGSFLFTGVTEGSYYLLGSNEDKKYVRLDFLEMRGTDAADFELALEPVTLIAECSEPNVLVGGVLKYEPEPTGGFEEKKGRLLDGGTLAFENVLAGTYTLRADLHHGISLRQVVEVQAGAAEQVISVELPAESTIHVRGKVTGTRPAELFLISADQRVRVELRPDAEGNYELTDVPADTYSLATVVNGRTVEFSRIGLFAGPEVVMDLELDKIASPFSPLYGIVVNSDGLIVGGARVWLTGGDEASLTLSMGHGAFLAAPAGTYTLHAAHERYGSASREIVLKKMPLTSGATPENTFVLELK